MAIRDGTIKDFSADHEGKKKEQNTQDKLIMVDFHNEDNREYPLVSDFKKQYSSLTSFIDPQTCFEVSQMLAHFLSVIPNS